MIFCLFLTKACSEKKEELQLLQLGVEYETLLPVQMMMPVCDSDVVTCTLDLEPPLIMRANCLIMT